MPIRTMGFLLARRVSLFGESALSYVTSLQGGLHSVPPPDFLVLVRRGEVLWLPRSGCCCCCLSPQSLRLVSVRLTRLPPAALSQELLAPRIGLSIGSPLVRSQGDTSLFFFLCRDKRGQQAI